MKKGLIAIALGVAMSLTGCQSEREQKISQLAKMGFKNELPYFFKAASKGKVEALTLFKELGMDFNQKNKSGNTVLVIAANKGNAPVVSKLLELGADPRIKGGTKGFTPLVDVVSLGKLDMVKLIVEAPKKDAQGQELILGTKKAFLMACSQGFTEIVKYLSEKDQSLFQAKNNLNKTALLLAVEKGHLGVVQALIAGGTDLNIPDSDGNTPLAYAKDYGYPKVAKALRVAGAK